MLQVEAALAEFRGQGFEQLGMGRGIVRSEVIHRFGKPVAQKMSPHAVDQRFLEHGRIDDQFAELFPAVHLRHDSTAPDGGPVHKHRIGNFHLAITQLVVDLGLAGRTALAREIRVDQFRIGHTPGPFLIVPLGPRLTKERVHFPELALLPIVERVVVALRTLHLETQKDLGCHGRGLRRFIVIDFHDQKVHRTVESLHTGCGGSGGGHQFVHQAVIRLVASHGLAEVIAHAVAARQTVRFRAAAATDQHVGPHCRPIPHVLVGILFTLQQFLDQFAFLGRIPPFGKST